MNWYNEIKFNPFERIMPRQPKLHKNYVPTAQGYFHELCDRSLPDIFSKKHVCPWWQVENSTLTLKFWALRSKRVKRSFGARITLNMIKPELLCYVIKYVTEPLLVMFSENNPSYNVPVNFLFTEFHFKNQEYISVV